MNADAELHSIPELADLLASVPQALDRHVQRVLCNEKYRNYELAQDNRVVVEPEPVVVRSKTHQPLVALVWFLTLHKSVSAAVLGQDALDPLAKKRNPQTLEQAAKQFLHPSVLVLTRIGAGPSGTSPLTPTVQRALAYVLNRRAEDGKLTVIGTPRPFEARRGRGATFANRVGPEVMELLANHKFVDHLARQEAAERPTTGTQLGLLDRGENR